MRAARREQKMTRRGIALVSSGAAIAAVAGLTLIAPAHANGHPQFSASGALDFGAQATGTTSATLTETITNLADSDVNWLEIDASGVTVSGVNAEDFAVLTDNCSGQRLLAQGTCTVTVSFTPTATGNRAAELNFAFTGNGNLDPGSPQSVALSGQGTAPVAQVPLSSCVTAPKRLPKAGTRQLMKANCITNANQAVRVSVSRKGQRGDIKVYRVIRKADGATFIKTYGVKATIVVTWSAPEAAGYTVYSTTQKYRIGSK